MKKKEIDRITLLKDTVILDIPKEFVNNFTDAGLVKSVKMAPITSIKDIEDRMKELTGLWSTVVRIGKEVEDIEVGDQVWLAGFGMAAIEMGKGEFFLMCIEKELRITKAKEDIKSKLTIV